jgi:hypothetical protein
LKGWLGKWRWAAATIYVKRKPVVITIERSTTAREREKKASGDHYRAINHGERKRREQKHC